MQASHVSHSHHLLPLLLLLPLPLNPYPSLLNLITMLRFRVFPSFSLLTYSIQFVPSLVIKSICLSSTIPSHLISSLLSSPLPVIFIFSFLQSNSFSLSSPQLTPSLLPSCESLQCLYRQLNDIIPSAGDQSYIKYHFSPHPTPSPHTTPHHTSPLLTITPHHITM